MQMYTIENYNSDLHWVLSVYLVYVYLVKKKKETHMHI